MTTTMSLRNLALAMGLSAVFAAVGYGVGASRPKVAGPASGGGPSVVTFEGGGVTAEELRAAIEEQGPLLRASHAQPEALRRLALELARQKLVERDAEAKGYDRAPEIVRERRRALVALYLKRELEEQQAGRTFSEGELQGWLDQHRSEFAHPERARIADLFLAAPPPGKERERKRAEAEALLRDLRRRAPHDVYAFATAARGRSDDAATRASGRELPPRPARRACGGDGRGPRVAAAPGPHPPRRGTPRASRGCAVRRAGGARPSPGRRRGARRGDPGAGEDRFEVAAAPARDHDGAHRCDPCRAGGLSWLAVG